MQGFVCRTSTDWFRMAQISCQSSYGFAANRVSDEFALYAPIDARAGCNDIRQNVLLGLRILSNDPYLRFDQWICFFVGI
jgi:hypothetical protein